MVQGSWVGDPFSFFLPFSVMLFNPYERISCPGWGLDVSHTVPRSLSFSSLFSPNDVDARRLRDSGSLVLENK